MPLSLSSAPTSAARDAAIGPIRVASVPSGHVYVRHLSPPHEASEPRVVRLTDPHPTVPGRSAAAQWWPPRMLDPDWVRANGSTFDVFHIHFGFDACSPQTLAELVTALREQQKPLVYTVHDLRNPHHTNPAEHDAQLDVLIPASDALITLTPGAAGEIERRWGRAATVLAHPHIVPLDVLSTWRAQRASVQAERDEVRVGVHVKSLRAGMDPLPVLRVLSESIASIPGGVLQVNGHRDVLERDGARYDRILAEWLRTEAGAGRLELHVHDYFTDDELWQYLASLDVSVLPYRNGPHSGWLEACRDLGTTVIAPTCGYYADQGPVLSFGFDAEHFDAESLRSAVRAAATSPAPTASVRERRAQREETAAAHTAIYEGLLI